MKFRKGTYDDIARLYDEVRKRYGELGYDVVGDRLVVSEQPTYTNGKIVPKDVLDPAMSGGNTQDDGTIRISPKYRDVKRNWNASGPDDDFLRTIIGHEMGHHIDRTFLSKPEHAKERALLLRQIAQNRFRTVYTDSYGKDTPKKKLDKEMIAEYLSFLVNKKLEFSDGSYEDAKAVYESLPDSDKEFVTPGRREYRDARGNLAARTVAYDNKVPVGVADLYGPCVIDRKGAKPYYNVWTAVSPDHRGKHLSPDLVKESIRKLVRRLRSEGTLAQNAAPRVEWHFLEGNERSRHAAINAGFVRKGKRKYEFAIPKEAGMAKCAKDNKTQLDYLRYLRNFSETPLRVEEVQKRPPDWTPVQDLEREGYFRSKVDANPDTSKGQFVLSTRELTEDPYFMESFEKHKDTCPTIEDAANYAVLEGSRYDEGVVTIPTFRGMMPRSTLAHETGHVGHENKKSSYYLGSWNDPYYAEGGRRVMRPEHSVESLTNGVNKTQRVLNEEEAWDRAQGAYDQKERELALATYYAGDADEWRARALRDSFGDPSDKHYLPASRIVLSEGKLPDYEADPEVAEFWRTNNVPQAYNYLKTLPPVKKRKFPLLFL